MSQVRPMLAATAPSDRSKLSYPLLASPKIDGVRCLIKAGRPVSRTLKPIPNHFVQDVLSDSRFEGLDGELVVGDPTAPGLLQTTVSGVMSASGTPDFTYYVFDKWDRKVSYETFLRDFEPPHRGRVEFLSQAIVPHHTGLENFYEHTLDQGFEGIVTRSPDSPYKFGRSTLRQEYLLKIKERVQGESRVIGYNPLFTNENDPVINALGLTERSHHKDGKVELAVLGALVCVTPQGVEFRIGTGFTFDQRKFLWETRVSLPGRIAIYESAPYGVKSAPRNPSFKAFGSELDREGV